MKTPAERATDLVNQWLEDTKSMPMPLQLARLGILIASELREYGNAVKEKCAEVCHDTEADGVVFCGKCGKPK